MPQSLLPATRRPHLLIRIDNAEAYNHFAGSLPTQMEGARSWPPSTRTNPALLQKAQAPSNTSCVICTSCPPNTRPPSNSKNGSAETRTTNTCLCTSSNCGTLMWTTSFLERQQNPQNAPPDAKALSAATARAGTEGGRTPLITSVALGSDP